MSRDGGNKVKSHLARGPEKLNTRLLNYAFYSVQCRIILMKEAMETGITLKKAVDNKHI